MDNQLAKMIEKKAVRTKGKALKHEVPEVINRSEFSDYSIEILEHFGIDAPSHLNTYCCALEDALVESIQKQSDYRQVCLLLKDEIERLRELVPEKDRYPEELQSEED